MKVVFVVPKERKAEVKKILESDPYGEFSFAKIGYKWFERDKIYLYFSINEDLYGKIKEKLNLERAKNEAELIKIIEEEEDRVASGFSLFE